MNYSQDAFLRLMAEVEDQGGEHLDEVCEDRVYKIPTQPSGEPKPYRSTRCKAVAKFMVPYEPEGNTTDGVIALAKVCAVDDSLGAWPRFQDEVGRQGVTV